MHTNETGREPEPTDAAVLMELARQYDENIAPNWPNRIWDRVEIAADRGREYLSGARPMPDTPGPVLSGRCKEVRTLFSAPWHCELPEGHEGCHQFTHEPAPDEVAQLRAEVARLKEQLRTCTCSGAYAQVLHGKADEAFAARDQVITQNTALTARIADLERENAALGEELAALREGNKPPVYEHHPGWVCTKEAQAYFDKEADPGKEAPDAGI